MSPPFRATGDGVSGLLGSQGKTLRLRCLLGFPGKRAGKVLAKALNALGVGRPVDHEPFQAPGQSHGRVEGPAGGLEDSA